MDAPQQFPTELTEFPFAAPTWGTSRDLVRLTLYFGMQKGRCIGLIGGLGVGAAVHYYTHLADAYQQRGILLDLVMAHADIPTGMRYIDAGDRAGLAQYLLGFIQRLAAAGAELAIVPAVTPHYCIHELKAISPLPVIDIANPLAIALASGSIRKAALFGTRYVMESDFYSLIPGVEFVHPQRQEIDAIHSTYVDLAATHRATPEAHARLTSIAETLISRDGAEVIVFAGTDLALLFNETNTAFPAIDCAALHIDAIVKASLNGA
jgi:aspartate racemase